jgi:hypothetical protein
MLAEVEEEVNVPHFLARIVEDHKSSLEKVKITVLAKDNTLLNSETARVAIRTGISIYAGAENQKLILDPNVPMELGHVEEAVLKRIQDRSAKAKRIPEAIVQHLGSLKNLEYSSDLRQFGHDYERVEFADRASEHQFVHDFLIDRLAKKYASQEFLYGLNAMSLLEDVSQVLLAKREHFLHSFQTFLLGAIVIDKNYKLFNSWYSERFHRAADIGIDLPWFFTSLFHDIGITPMFQKSDKGITSIFGPSLLESLFDAIRSNSINGGWDPEKHSGNGRLRSLLASRRRVDHGVVGALTLLSCASDMERNAQISTVWPASLAIALHNSDLWPRMVREGIFPQKATAFPLLLLLLFCDNVEEWGREPVVADDALLSALLGIDFKNASMCCNVWVKEQATAAVMRNRHQWITQELLPCENFQFECCFFQNQFS